METAHKRQTLDLDLFVPHHGLRSCLCGKCDSLRTRLGAATQPGERWTLLCRYVQEEDALCPLLNGLYESTIGSFCRWSICYNCFVEGKMSSKPSTEPIRVPIDVNSFHVLQRDNADGHCSKHGNYFKPYCIGEPPLLICMQSENAIESSDMQLCPLSLSWSGSKVFSGTASAFAYIPNAHRWPRYITYKIECDVTIYPLHGEGDGLVREYTYILRRVTSPITPSPLLEDLLQARGFERNIWIIQHCIMDTSNRGVTVTGESILSRIPRIQTTTASSPRFSKTPPSCCQGTKIVAEKGQLDKLDERGENQNYTRSNERNTTQRNIIFPSGNKPNSVSRLGFSSLRTAGRKGTDFFVNDEGPACLRGDPLYHPSCKDEDDSEGEEYDPSFDASPVSRRLFLYEDEVMLAERRDERKQEERAQLRENSRAPENLAEIIHRSDSTFPSFLFDHPVSTMTFLKGIPQRGTAVKKEPDVPAGLSDYFLFQDSYRTSYKRIPSMEYRTPILRAASFSSPYAMEHSEENRLTVMEACELLEEKKFPFVRSTLKDLPRIDFRTASKDRPRQLTSLRVNIDIDSIDVLTIPLGGTAFNSSNGSIFLTWNQSYARNDEVLIRNNGFIRFHDAYSELYPGNYFGVDVTVNTRDGNSFRATEEEPLLNDPIQVQVGSINLSWRYPVKIFGIIPSKSLLYLLKGSGALLELFDHYAYGDGQRGSRISARTRLSQATWYLLTSILLLFSSIGSKDGSSPSVWVRDPCCAFASVDSRNDRMHDRKYGHLSDYNSVESLSPGTLTIALCLFARHQRALEQHAQVPDHLRCRAFENVEQYRLPENLYPTVNTEVLHVLKADIGNETCLRWFQGLWSLRSYRLGELGRLQSDPERRREFSFPSDESCREACKRGYLCVEDMLSLSCVIFRGTVHGAKAPAYTAGQLRGLGRQLFESFNPSCFKDGIIDIAYVFHSPPEADLSVHLRREAAEERFKDEFETTNVLTPIGCKKSLRELGAYFSGSPGYPTFIGFSTRRGTCGQAESGITYSGPRKVKAYSTKWKGDSYRGRTMYQASPAKFLLKTLSNSRALYKLIVDAQIKGGEKLQECLENFEREQQKVYHNIQYRVAHMDTYQNTNGFRVEYTCFFDPLFHFLEEPLDVACMQDERFGMTQALVHEILRKNPRYFPWWMSVKVPYGQQENHPLCLVSNRWAHKFSLLIEARALDLSAEVFIRSATYLAQYDLSEITFSQQSNFLEPILRTLPTTEAGVKFACVVATALYRLSYRQVDNVLCSRDLVVPCSPDGWMSSSGLAASWWYSGIPAILLSRLCRFPAFKSGYSIDFHDGSCISVSEREASLLSSEDDLLLPSCLRFERIIQHYSVRSLHILETDDAEGHDTILTSMIRFLEPIFQERTELVRQRTSFKIGAFVVKMLIADLAHAMLCSSKDTSNAEEEWYEKKFGDTIETRNLVTLSALSQENEMWPKEYRIDVPLSETSASNTASVELGMSIFEDIFHFFTKPVQVVTGSPWTRKTIPVDRDGFISDEEFINLLFEEASHKPSEEDMIRTTSSRKWRSVLSLEAVIDIFRLRDQGDIFPHFSKLLARAISKSLKSAGFGTISAAFLRGRLGLRRESRSLWGPDLLFAKMRFLSEEDDFQVRLHTKHPMEALGHSEREIQDIFEALSRIHAARGGLEVNSVQWNALTDEYKEISRRFWSILDIEDRILKSIQLRFDSIRTQTGLVELDLAWAQALVQKLMQIRKAVGDEGICCQHVNGEIISVRDLRAKPRKAMALQYPWGTLYPNAEDVYKKKTRVRQAGSLFISAFPLLFKTKTKTEIERAGQKSLLSECFLYSVEDVYHSLRAVYDEQIAGRKAHWRLAPTRIIAKLLLK